MTFSRDQHQNYVYSKHAINTSLKLPFRNSFFTVGWVFWLNQINGHSPKYSESRLSSGLNVTLCLKNVTFLHSFCKRKHIGQAGQDLQFVLIVTSIYDSGLTFLFLVGVEYLSKPEVFSLRPFLIEGGHLLPSGVKMVTSTARCNSL